MKLKLLLIGIIAFLGQSFAQTGYSSHSQLTARLKNLSGKSKASTLTSIGKSSGGKDIWLVTLAQGDASKNKAILIVAGADGRHPAGMEMATKLAERLTALPSDSLSNVLKNRTIYLIPALSPDALEQASASLKYERSGNATIRDDDRDGKTDEDPFEDLNRDGLITTIRIEDPTGAYILSKDDPRVLIKADASKGETGKYLIYSEGIDNDQDGKFNEDGPGGVNIDKNFTFDYPIFEEGAGEYQASEPETRAFLDFLYKNVNIHTVFHLGLSNNLTDPIKFDRMKASKRLLNGILEKDAAANDMVSKMYNKAGLKDAPSLPQTLGNLTQTAYFHAGRFSYATPGWWVPKSPLDDASKKPLVPSKKSNNPEVDYLKWADANGINSFVNWTSINHPDFLGKKVEVGGLSPYSLNNPPTQYLDSAVNKHLVFFNEYLNAMPATKIVNTKVDALGNGINRITLTVLNNGLLPSNAEIGDRVRFVYKVSTKLKVSGNQTVISGNKNNYRSALKAGESVEYSWLINGSGKVVVEAGSPTSGIENLEITLK